MPQLLRHREYEQRCVSVQSHVHLVKVVNLFYTWHTTQEPCAPSSWTLRSMIHAATKVKWAVRWAVRHRLRQKKRITIQNLLNEFKNSYFSAFAIQSLRLGLRQGGRKKKKMLFAFLLGARQRELLIYAPFSAAALLSAVITWAARRRLVIFDSATLRFMKVTQGFLRASSMLPS